MRHLKHLNCCGLKLALFKHRIPLTVGLLAGLLTGTLPTDITNGILLLFIVSMALVYWKFRSGIGVLIQFAAFSTVITACIFAPLKSENKKVDMRGVGSVKLSDMELLEIPTPPSLHFPKEMHNLKVNFPEKIMEVKEILKLIDNQASAAHAVGVCGWDTCTLLFGCQPMGNVYFRYAEKP